MSWAKYKDAEKHFTLTVTYYSPDNQCSREVSTNNFNKTSSADEEGTMLSIIITDKRSNQCIQDG